MTDDDLNRLRQVNNRLLELEKSLKQMVDGMRERLEGLNPTAVEWDDWDSVKILLWLTIGSDLDRPAYDPNNSWAEDGLMEPLEIRVSLYERWENDAEKDEELWGLDDGLDHSDLGGCEGHPLQYFHQCYLFHEFFAHSDVGVWGMLNLQSVWIEIIPHRSADFKI